MLEFFSPVWVQIWSLHRSSLLVDAMLLNGLQVVKVESLLLQFHAFGFPCALEVSLGYLAVNCACSSLWHQCGPAWSGGLWSLEEACCYLLCKHRLFLIGCFLCCCRPSIPLQNSYIFIVSSCFFNVSMGKQGLVASLTTFLLVLISLSLILYSPFPSRRQE